MAFDKLNSFTKPASSMPDDPTGAGKTPDDIRSYWQSDDDELKTTINNVVDKLNSTTDGASGADNIGATGFDGTASTVQTMLETLNTNKATSGTNWTGTWQGFSPSQVDQTIRDQVNTNTSQLANIAIDVKHPPAPIVAAKLDGITDDSPTIQAVINYLKNSGGKILLPLGNCLINQVINATDIRTGITLIGLGDGSVVAGNTGGILFDTTGSQKFKFKNLFITGGSTNPSTLGILFARSTTNIYAEFNQLENVTIDLPSAPSANGGNGSIGVYNFSSELGNGNNVTIGADIPIVFTNTNIFNIVSSFTTIHPVGTDNISMSEWLVDGLSTLKPKTGVAYLLDNVLGITVDAYILKDGTRTAGSQYAFEIKNTCMKINIKGHIENFTKVGLINGNTTNGTYVTDLDIHVTKQIFGTDDQVVLDGTVGTTGLYGGSINIVPTATTYSHNSISQIGASHIGVMAVEIVLNQSQTLNLPNGKTTSLKIKAYDAASITLSSNYNGTIIQRQDMSYNYGVSQVDTLKITGNYSLGGYTHAFGGGPPASGTWQAGDRIVNNFPSEQGTAGSKYIVSEWQCVAGGTPGTWLPLRCLTGN